MSNNLETENELVAVPVRGSVVTRNDQRHLTLEIDRKQGNFFLWCPKGTHDRKVSGHTLTLDTEDVVTVSRTEQHPEHTVTVLQLIQLYSIKEI